MAIGKMNAFIDIIATEKIKDSAGFATEKDIVKASVRAFQEYRSGTVKWANRAQFSTANWLFIFRVIPGLEVTTKMKIGCGGKQYKITSIEDVRGRNMYLEVLAESIG